MIDVDKNPLGLGPDCPRKGPGWIGARTRIGQRWNLD